MSGWCWKAEALNAAAEYLESCALSRRGACCRAWPCVKVLGRLLFHRLVFRRCPCRRNAKSIAAAAADARWPERSARVRKTKRARLLTALRAGPPLLGWYTSGGPPRGRSLLKDRDVRTYAKKITTPPEREGVPGGESGRMHALCFVRTGHTRGRPREGLLSRC